MSREQTLCSNELGRRMPIAFVLSESTIVLLGAAGCENSTPKSSAGLADWEAGRELTKTREDVKALFPAADSWLEAEQGGASFIFCATDLPSYGSSRIAIHAFIFRRHSNRWEEVFSVRTNGVGQVMLSVDSNTGLFEAKGSANNQFMNQAVFTIDLNATQI